MSNESVRGLVEELRRYRKAEADKKQIWGCVGAVVKAFWALGMAFWWGPFAVMIAFGIVHGYASGVPALGYWEAFMVTVACRFLLGGRGRGTAPAAPAKKDAGA